MAKNLVLFILLSGIGMVFGFVYMNHYFFLVIAGFAFLSVVVNFLTDSGPYYLGNLGIGAIPVMN